MPHFYERNIIEIKEEYTTFLINIITPFLYEGIKSFYNYAQESHMQLLEKSKTNDTIKSPGVLKLFQACLKEVPSLNDYAIETETNRIKEKSKCSEWFDDLVKAVIKSNIVLLTFTTDENKSDIVVDKYHERINVKNFIHKCYIECARILYNYPELFWHEYPSIDIKRNQRETFNLIEKAIKEAIRKMLPIKMILQEFLKNDYIPDNSGVGNKISESHYMNMKSMIDRDLYNNNGELDEQPNDDRIEEHYDDQQNAYKEINDDKISDKLGDIHKQVEEFGDDSDETDGSTNSKSKSKQDIFYTNDPTDDQGNDQENNQENNQDNGPVDEYNPYPRKKITGNAKKILNKMIGQYKNNIIDQKNDQSTKESFFNKYTN